MVCTDPCRISHFPSYGTNDVSSLFTFFLSQRELFYIHTHLDAADVCDFNVPQTRPILCITQPTRVQGSGSDGHPVYPKAAATVLKSIMFILISFSIGVSVIRY